MDTKFNEKLIAYITLFSGLALSIVAEYYSIAGLTAIFAAAVIPVIIMGVALGLGKVVSTIWLKQNWTTAPWTIKVYLSIAIAMLMLITSMGTFGYLSKAHSDQNLVSGDVQSKIAIYDEKIKTAKENIESNRKQLKQMDEAVDQVMARSSDEKGAEKANAIRKNQSRDRVALAKDIEANQKLVVQLNDEAAPIRAEVRKVEAEVGPIKYIAAFVYGDTSESVLELAVTWVIILIIFVFDPLALILLIASQISFQKLRDEDTDAGKIVITPDGTIVGIAPSSTTADEILQAGVVNSNPEDNVPVKQDDLFPTYEEITPQHYTPPYHVTNTDNPVDFPKEIIVTEMDELDEHAFTTSTETNNVTAPVFRKKIFPRAYGYVQNEEQTTDTAVWSKITSK
jgi:Skp family chaperone for outer membrane proteins